MIDERDLLERALRHFEPEPGLTDRVYRRRDRKRRNQRIAAGVVGIAVFVAAVGLVTTFGSSDRTQPGASGGAVTGPTQTGPAETGPTVDPDTGWWLDAGTPELNLPPEGAVPSTPEEGVLVAKYRGFLPSSGVYVYADGRVISWLIHSAPPDRINERRLTPEGVELVRSGAIQAEDLLYAEDLPAHLWEDPELKPYVPSRYSVCYGREGSEPADPSTLLRFFPAPARAILLRAETSHAARTPPGCNGGEGRSFVVTTDEARALLEILGAMSWEAPTPGMVRIEDSEGVGIYWAIVMMLPDGPPPCTDCF
jgi:hypothetical protein